MNDTQWKILKCNILKMNKPTWPDFNGKKIKISDMPIDRLKFVESYMKESLYHKSRKSLQFLCAVNEEIKSRSSKY